MTTTTTRRPLRWTRQQAGRYIAQDADGWTFEARSIEFHSEGSSLERGWHLFHYNADRSSDPYCNTFCTFRDSKDAAEECIDERDGMSPEAWERKNR